MVVDLWGASDVDGARCRRRRRRPSHIAMPCLECNGAAADELAWLGPGCCSIRCRPGTSVEGGCQCDALAAAERHPQCGGRRRYGNI
jgi:hypothetical protein